MIALIKVSCEGKYDTPEFSLEVRLANTICGKRHNIPAHGNLISGTVRKSTEYPALKSGQTLYLYLNFDAFK